jgi:8-oxo-dGTP diphosphatase
VDETISSVLGKNKKANTLSKIGKGLDWILDILDKNHSIKSIEAENL